MTGRPGPCGCGCALTRETSLGFSAVDFASEVVGFAPLPWQRWLLIHGLELQADGRYRFRTVLVLVARQSGKTSCIEIKNLWKMFVQGAQVLGTAQDLDVSEESWDNAVGICEGIPELAAEVDDVVKVNGKKALKLSNGARWKVKAANRRGGRGFSADDVNLDELREHQSYLAWGAVTKTTLARRNAQIWAFTNAGDDKSVVLNDLQARARATVADPMVDPALGLFEWSFPDEVECDCGRVPPRPHLTSCSLADRRYWVMANPAYGYTITDDALQSALNTDPDAVFRTESGCQRVQDLAPAIVSLARWAEWHDPDSSAHGSVVFCLDFDPDLASASIGFTGRRSDGLAHWQLVAHGSGTSWALATARDLQAEWGSRIACWVMDKASPAAAKKADMEKAGMTVHLLGAEDTAQACTNMLEAAQAGPGRLGGDSEQAGVVARAWRAAALMPSGDSRRFARRRSSAGITPLMVITLSDHGFRLYGEKKRPAPLFAFSE